MTQTRFTTYQNGDLAYLDVPDIGLPVVVAAHLPDLALVADREPGSYGILPYSIHTATWTTPANLMAQSKADHRAWRLFSRPVDRFVLEAHQQVRKLLEAPPGVPLATGVALQVYPKLDHTVLPEPLQSVADICGVDPQLLLAICLEIVCPARTLTDTGRLACGLPVEDRWAPADPGWAEYDLQPFPWQVRTAFERLAYGARDQADPARLNFVVHAALTGWALHIRQTLGIPAC